MKKLFVFLMLISLVLSSVVANGSQESSSSTGSPAWPTQPIHIIGQASAGAGPDLFVRELQPLLQEQLGASVVVENKAGSGGKIACDYVWKASPDGYTLLAHSSPLTTVTQISKNCEYSIKDMKHIVAFDIAPYAVIVKADSPIKTISDLIEAAKSGKISNANSGIGGAMYLQSRIMAKALGIDYAEVPYDGTNPCILAVMNGDVTFSIADYSTAVNNDQIRIVCLLSDKRISFVPDAETIVEQGYSIPFMTMRRGVVAPPNTPDDVCEKLVEAFKNALNNPKFIEYANTNGFQLDILYGDDYKAKDVEYYETALQFKDYL